MGCVCVNRPYCNAHGTATRAGDLVECDALAALWGDDLAALRVSSTKSMHGHLLGAAGALEAVITVLSLHHGCLPPNAHCSVPDPQCKLNLVLEPGVEAPHLKAALSNSFAFGGSNSALLFARD
jgi:3-oxoacyl-[acyl-carrier-protein] synthase II